MGGEGTGRASGFPFRACGTRPQSAAFRRKDYSGLTQSPRPSRGNRPLALNANTCSNASATYRPGAGLIGRGFAGPFPPSPALTFPLRAPRALVLPSRFGRKPLAGVQPGLGQSNRSPPAADSPPCPRRSASRILRRAPFRSRCSQSRAAAWLPGACWAFLRGLTCKTPRLVFSLF